MATKVSWHVPHVIRTVTIFLFSDITLWQPFKSIDIVEIVVGQRE